VISVPPDPISISSRESSANQRCRFRPSNRCGVRVVVRLTQRCSMACAHCLAGATGSSGNDLKLHEWQTILRELPDIGAHKVLLSGGEPLLFSGLVALVRYIAAMGIATDLNSTLWLLTQDLARELAAGGLTEASISLEGPEEVHDAMHGRPGAWGRLRAGVIMLHELGIPVDGSLCVTSANIEHVPATIAEGARWGLASFTVSRTLPIGHGARQTTSAIPEERLAALHQELTADGGRFDIPLRVVGLLGPPDASDCPQGQSLIGIRADGTLTPCLLSRDPVSVSVRPLDVGLTQAMASMRGALQGVEAARCWGPVL
jgi:MoaA/NifB/PqqE/SkfB family radical SAM enzyme